MSAMRRRDFLAGTFASLTAAGLSGCSDQVVNGLRGEPPDTPQARPRRYEGEIVIATLQSAPPPVQEALTNAYRRFQPGVRIRWETQDWPDEDTYANWLESRLSDPDTRPDIISGSHRPEFREYVNLEEYRWRINPYTREVWDKDYLFGRSRVFNAAGERTGVGTEGLCLSWYHNLDLFSDLDLEAPTTWEDLVTVCDALSDEGITPIAAGLDRVIGDWLAPVYFDQYHTSWVEVVRAEPGDWNWNPQVDPGFTYDAMDPRLHLKYTFNAQRFYRGLREGDLRFDTPEVAELMTNLRQVFPRYADPAVLTTGRQYGAFLRGSAAMMADGSWSLARLRTDMDQPDPQRLAGFGLTPETLQPFEWDVFGFPPMQGGLTQSGQVRPPEGATGYEMCVVEKNAQQTALVMDFLMFWLSEPGYSVFVDAQEETGGWTPGGQPLVVGVDYPQFDDLLEKSAQKGIAGPEYGDFLVNAAGGETSEVPRRLFGDCMRGTLDPEEFGKRLQRYVRRNFADLLAAAGLTQADLDNPARRPRSL